MDLNGMNSSITPLSAVRAAGSTVQWLNWHAARVLGMLRGSYLFRRRPEADHPGPGESQGVLDPAGIGVAGLGRAARYRRAADNSSDHNPAVRTDLSPQDSWELSTPQMMKYYVKGGERSGGKHGYIVSNANWDPYPLANKLEAFVICAREHGPGGRAADRAIQQSVLHGDDPAQVLHATAASSRSLSLGEGRRLRAGRSAAGDPEPDEPDRAQWGGDRRDREDLQAQTRIKAYRARQAVATTFDLLGMTC